MERTEGPRGDAAAATREKGIAHGARRDRITWREKSARRRNASSATRASPMCVIIGGGQGGIALGARLKRLGVPTIIVEKNPRAGDSWRNRYRSLVLHDPVWYDHLPYLPFPEHWPVFTPKDKMGDWLEMYAKVMELNYWGSTECLSAVTTRAQGTGRCMFAATARRSSCSRSNSSSRPAPTARRARSTLPGQDSFAGVQYHSSQHVTRRRLPRQALHRRRRQQFRPRHLRRSLGDTAPTSP